MASQEHKNIVIIGGGIVGVSTAYYLTRNRLFNSAAHTVTLLEASGIASGSSGKGGGFVASWATPECLAPLSFSLHASLAQAHDGADGWGYRAVHAAEVDLQVQEKSGSSATTAAAATVAGAVANRSSSSRRSSPAGVGAQERDPTAGDAGMEQPQSQPHQRQVKDLDSGGVPAALDWLDLASLKAYRQFGTPRDSAQVHPYLLTATLARLAQEAGVSVVVPARVTCVNYTDVPLSDPRSHSESRPNVSTNPSSKTVESVTFLGVGGQPQTIPATDVVVAAGPWTSTLLPDVKLLAPKGHSLVIHPTRDLSAYILFGSITSVGPSGPLHRDHPEGQEQEQKPLLVDIYPRPRDPLHAFQTAYASGPDHYDSPLPETAAQVCVEDDKCREVWDAISGVSAQLAGGEVVTRQACHKAQIRKHEDGGEVGPMIGRLGAARGLWLATGLDEWGIQNGPGVGLVMSEMILEGEAKSADVRSLDPKHWM